MKAVLESFKQMKGDHKTVILGDMFEIGEDSVKEHFHILDTCQYLGFENILVCGERFHKVSSEFENVIGFKTTSDLQKYIEEDISRISSPILVKGSRGMKLESIMDVL